MASNSESPTRSRIKHKQKRNENMEVETNVKEDALERSIEEIRSKMMEKRRKKGQADLSRSRSRYKNANLVLKATLRQNNRNLAKSLEVARNECRHAQNDLVELQRERHLLQSVVNRFQDQHAKQRSQIKGVHEVLRKVTSSLMDTVGLLGQAMDMCVIPRHTKDRSLGLVFRTSSLTSDDLSDSETKEEGRSASAETSSQNLSGIPRRIPANKEIITQSPVVNNLTEEIEDLPDIDIPLLFMSDKTAPQGKERTRRDTRNISAGNQKPSRRTSSLLDPATIAAVATEIEKSAESIRTVVEETDDDGEGTDERQALICIDDKGNAEDEEMDGVRSVKEILGRKVTKKRSGRPSLRKEAEVHEHEHSEDKEKENVSSVSKDEEMRMDGSHKGKVGKRKSGRLSQKTGSYVCPDDDEYAGKEKEECMELGPEDEDIVERNSDRRSSGKRSGRLSRRRGTFVKEDGDLKTFGIDDDLQEIEIIDDDDEEDILHSKEGNLNQQKDNTEEVVTELQQRPRSRTCDSNEGATKPAEKKAHKKSKKKKKDPKVKKIKTKDIDPEDVGEDVIETDQHYAVNDVQDDKHVQKRESIPDQRNERVKDENSAEKSDYRIVDMELTTAASGHISVIEGADPQTKSNEKNENEGKERSQLSKDGSPDSDRDASQKAGKSTASCREKPKSRLPVMMKSKSKTSKLKKSLHKSQSRMGTNNDSVRRRDEKDVQQMTVFDLSMGDSFSHPTPSRLITKPRAPTETNSAEAVEKDTKVCPPTTDRGSGDGLEKVAQTELSNDAEAGEAFPNQGCDPHQDGEIIGEEKHSKIKRKSRKSKSVVTPGAAEPKVRLSEKALLEELSNLDASYLSDITNPERKSKIGASLPSRKSSQKDGGESLNDLMVRPHHRKTSKRKLSKRNFYFGDSESEDDQRHLRADRKSEARTSELSTSTLNTSSLNPDNPNPDSTSSLPKTSSSCLNTTIDILEDLENVLLEVDEPKESKKINRRTTILKPNGQTSRGASNLNVTFVKDDVCDFEDIKKDKISKSTQNSENGTIRIGKAKDLKQANRKTFVIEDTAKTFLGNFDDAEIVGDLAVGGEVGNVIAEISETQTSKQSTTKSVQSSAENHTSTTESRTGNEDVLEALDRPSSVRDDRLDEPEANKNEEAEEEKRKKKIGNTICVNSSDIVEKQTSVHSTMEPGQPSWKDDVSRSANDDEFEALDRSSSKTQNNQPDESEPSRREEERKEAKVQKTNKRKAKAGDDDILDGQPSKVAKADSEPVPDMPQRRGRRSKAVSYKEPKLNRKLRQGDPNTFSVYKKLPGTTSIKDQVRAPLSNITN